MATNVDKRRALLVTKSEAVKKLEFFETLSLIAEIYIEKFAVQLKKK